MLVAQDKQSGSKSNSMKRSEVFGLTIVVLSYEYALTAWRKIVDENDCYLS